MPRGTLTRGAGCSIPVLLYSLKGLRQRKNIRICGRADTTLSTIIIGDGRAAEQIPHDAQGRFLMEDGTVFQAYYFNDATLK